MASFTILFIIAVLAKVGIIEKALKRISIKELQLNLLMVEEEANVSCYSTPKTKDDYYFNCF